MNSNTTHYPLQDFANQSRSFTITAGAGRQDSTLCVDFQVSGDRASLVLPERTSVINRMDKLWLTTCFECFFKAKGKKGYWELNVSPNGCWNLYRFSGYRYGMVEEELVTQVISQLSQKDNSLNFSCSLPISGLIPPKTDIAMGLSCILEEISREKSYWALHHPVNRPDFHHPESMVLVLPYC